MDKNFFNFLFDKKVLIKLARVTSRSCSIEAFAFALIELPVREDQPNGLSMRIARRIQATGGAPRRFLRDREQGMLDRLVTTLPSVSLASCESVFRNPVCLSCFQSRAERRFFAYILADACVKRETSERILEKRVLTWSVFDSRASTAFVQ